MVTDDYRGLPKGRVRPVSAKHPGFRFQNGSEETAPRCHAVVPLPTALALRPQLLWKGLQRVRENSVVPPESVS